MINLKKLISALLLSFLLAVNISALSPDQITPDSSFLIYSANPKDVAVALKTDEDSLKEKVKKQNIMFLAVNSDNTKQIQLTVNETQFANTVGNLSNLSDSSIKSLLPDITGIENIKGNIVIKDGQKYVKINLKTDDDGYILTQYFTVENKKLFTLSFYTDQDTDTDYIETAFPTDTASDDSITIGKTPKIFKIAVIIGIMLFSIIFILLLISLIKDLRDKKVSNS